MTFDVCAPEWQRLILFPICPCISLSLFIQFSMQVDPLFTFNPALPHQHLLKPLAIAPTHTPHNLCLLDKGAKEIFGSANRIRYKEDQSLHLQRKQCLQRQKEDSEEGGCRKRMEKEIGQAIKISAKNRREAQSQQFLVSTRYSPSRNGGNQMDLMSFRPLRVCQSRCSESSHRIRALSLKMSPRIVVPLSDRKLPKVFKAKHRQEHQDYQSGLPPIHRHQMRKYQSLQLRQVYSANRGRCLLQRISQRPEHLGIGMEDWPSLLN